MMTVMTVMMLTAAMAQRMIEPHQNYFNTAVLNSRAPANTLLKHEGLQLATSFCYQQMGLSENSVPLHPMVSDHYPY